MEDSSKVISLGQKPKTSISVKKKKGYQYVMVWVRTVATMEFNELPRPWKNISRLVSMPSGLGWYSNTGAAGVRGEKSGAGLVAADRVVVGGWRCKSIRSLQHSSPKKY